MNEKSLISEGEEPRQYKLFTANETAYIYTRYNRQYKLLTANETAYIYTRYNRPYCTDEILFSGCV